MCGVGDIAIDVTLGVRSEESNISYAAAAPALPKRQRARFLVRGGPVDRLTINLGIRLGCRPFFDVYGLVVIRESNVQRQRLLLMGQPGRDRSGAHFQGELRAGGKRMPLSVD